MRWLAALLLLGPSGSAFADFLLGRPVGCRPGRSVVASILGRPYSEQCVRLGRRVRIRGADLYLHSVRNDNSRYRLDVRGVRAGRDWLYLRYRPELFASSSSGGHGFTFELDRAHADGVAAVYGIVRNDRRPLNEGVTWEFTGPPRTLVAGAPIEVTLTVRSAGPLPLSLWGGGEHQLQCETWRDGRRVPTQPAFSNVGGVFTLTRETPAVIREDLRRRCAVDGPGDYELWVSFPIDLQTHAAIHPGTNGLFFDPLRRHERWEERATRRFDVQVR